MFALMDNAICILLTVSAQIIGGHYGTERQIDAITRDHYTFVMYV